MKKRILFIACLAAGIFIILSAVFIIKMINDASDYRKTLFDSGTSNMPAHEEEETGTLGMAKAEDEIKKLEEAEKSETEVYKEGYSLEPPDKNEAEPDTAVSEELSQANNSGSSVGTPPEKDSGLLNILFLGIDRTEERDSTLGVFRTDTIALASIDINAKTVDVLNIPRDTYVYIPEIGKKDKINHAYVWGGMGEKGIGSSIKTINDFIRYDNVDYYFAIDMEPVPAIVDDIGGVELDVEIDMKTHGANLSKGLQILDGSKADQYIRWRYSGDGDIGRIKRQQKFLRAVFSKLRDSDQLLNVLKIVLGYNKYIKTDMGPEKLLSLALLAKEIEPDKITNRIIPGKAQMINKVWYWVPDEEETDILLKNMFQPGF